MKVNGMRGGTHDFHKVMSDNLSRLLVEAKASGFSAQGGVHPAEDSGLSIIS
jgi:hypothetical protein